jgi:hypothetical protein
LFPPHCPHKGTVTAVEVVVGARVCCIGVVIGKGVIVGISVVTRNGVVANVLGVVVGASVVVTVFGVVVGGSVVVVIGKGVIVGISVVTRNGVVVTVLGVVVGKCCVSFKLRKYSSGNSLVYAFIREETVMSPLYGNNCPFVSKNLTPIFFSKSPCHMLRLLFKTSQLTAITYPVGCMSVVCWRKSS